MTSLRVQYFNVPITGDLHLVEETIMHASDWRSALQPHVRKGVVQQIMNAVKLYNPLDDDDDDEDFMQELEKFSQNFEHKTFAMATSQSEYFQSIISKEVSIMREMQEEAYQKIKMLKEMYLPELNVVYQKILNKIRQAKRKPNPKKHTSSGSSSKAATKSDLTRCDQHHLSKH